MRASPHVRSVLACDASRHMVDYAATAGSSAADVLAARTPDRAAAAVESAPFEGAHGATVSSLFLSPRFRMRLVSVAMFFHTKGMRREPRYQFKFQWSTAVNRGNRGNVLCPNDGVHLAVLFTGRCRIYLEKFVRCDTLLRASKPRKSYTGAYMRRSHQWRVLHVNILFIRYCLACQK
jgi:hypothetical protein